MKQKNNDYKIILIGNSAVGKTSIFKKISSGSFTDRNISTIGMDKRTMSFKDIEVELNGKKSTEEFNIILCDTAGQERYRAITKNYFQGSDIVFILYDITSRKTFEDVESWLESLSDTLSSWKTAQYSIYLFGNKLDVVTSEERPREVDEEEAEKLCKEKSIIFGGEISVKESSVEALTDLLINAWKEYVQKFGLKTEISSQKKMEGAKWVGKKKKKNCC